MTKTTVFLTGATGTMGWAGLQELLAHKEHYIIRVLARKSEKNIRKLGPLMQDIEVIWGDLTRYEDILKGVSGSDIVLHVGGMVSPQADYRPAATRTLCKNSISRCAPALQYKNAERSVFFYVKKQKIKRWEV